MTLSAEDPTTKAAELNMSLLASVAFENSLRSYPLDLGAKDEGGTPALEATGKTLSLMQTVVMSFGRNQSLGKPDLPIHHLHIDFPVQLVRKLVERMNELHFTDVAPEDGKKYKRNSESEANSPYIVVGTYEGAPYNTFTGLPDTARLAGAFEHGLLDGKLGQMASFQTTYKSTLRIEVPVWPDVQQAVLPAKKTKCQSGRPGTTLPVSPTGATTKEWHQPHMHRTMRQLSLLVQGTLTRKKRRRRKTPACHRRDKDASPSAKPFVQSQGHLCSVHWQ